LLLYVYYIICVLLYICEAGIKSTSDVGVNTSYELSLRSKLEMQDKSIVTDEFYNRAKYQYSLFCAKCEAHLPNRLPKKIYKAISVYPKLIDGDLTSLWRKDTSVSSLLVGK